MKTHYDVIGLGNAIMDIIAPVTDAFLTEHNMDKGGMALIDQSRALSLNKALSANGETQEIAGGSAANTMVGISALGCKAGYIGTVSYTHLRAHETLRYLVCRLLLEKKK